MTGAVAGVDVFQKYQGAVNWAEVAGAGARNVFVKLTNGPAVASPTGATYVKGAHTAGLAVGGYAYVLAGDPVAQADVFAAELTRRGALDLAPALDFEDPGLPATSAARRAWIVSFFTRLKAKIPALDRVLLYSSGAELVAINAGTITVPGLQVLIWDAEYGPNDGTEHPRTHYTAAVGVHQYTSVGHVSGVAGNVDRNTIYTDITAMEAAVTTDPLDEVITRAGTKADGTPETGTTTTRAELAWDDSHWDHVLGGQATIETLARAIQTSEAQQVTLLTQLAQQIANLTAGSAPVPGTYTISGGTIIIGQPTAQE